MWICPACGATNQGSGPCSRCLAANPHPHQSAEIGPYDMIGTDDHRRPSQAVFTTLGLCIAVLMIGGLVGAVGVATANRVDKSRSSGHSLLVSPDSTPTTQPGPAGEVEALIPSIQRFVEEHRGLKFTEPVKVTVLDDAGFRKRFESNAPSKAAAQELKTTERVLIALGLIPKGTDLSKTETSLYSAAVLGLYDPRTKELLVRGAKPTALVKTTLAHELTHALQDQHFKLEGKGKPSRDDEVADGFQAVVEGDAVRIQNEYLQSLPQEEQKQEELEEIAAAGGIPSDVPQALIAFAQFPYIFGPSFVEKVIAAAGAGRLDEAFEKPPVTTEQVIHPDLYLQGQPAAAIEKPKTGGTEIDHGVFGEFSWLLILSQAGANGLQAAAGWGGDKYVAWQDHDKTCVRDAIVFDTPTDRTEFRAAIEKWAAKHGNVKIAAATNGGLTITACK